MTEASTAAKKQAYDGAIDELALQLATYRNILPVLYPEKPNFQMPDDEASYKKMAKELVENGKTTVTGKNGDTLEISLDDRDPNSLDKRDTRTGGSVKEALGVTNINKIGSKSGFNAFASAIEDAVEENSSDFMPDLLKGASIKNVLLGLLQWVMGGFQGSLREIIANLTANNVHDKVTSNLRELRTERPDMAAMLTEDTIKKTADSAYSGVMEKAGVEVAGAPKKKTFADIVPITIDDAKVAKARNDVYQKIMYPRDDDPLSQQITNRMISGRKASNVGSFVNFIDVFGWTGLSDADLKVSAEKVASTIAGSIADYTTDPKTAKALAGLSKEDYVNAVVAQVSNDLKKNESKLGLPKSLDSKAANGKTNLENFEEEVRVKLLEGNNYEKLSAATRLAARSEEATKVAFGQARGAAKGANDLGISTAQKPGEVIVAMTGKDTALTPDSPTSGRA
jgi:hypothetical protein